MSTQLSQLSYGIRQYGIFVIFGLVGVVLIYNLGRYSYEACCTKKASPSPIVNVTFGVLENLQFAQKPTLSSGVTFNLETVDGQIPKEATKTAYVYPIPQKGAGLDYAQRAKAAADNAGLEGAQQEQNSDTTFLFINPADQNQRMTFHYVYDNIEYKYENLTSYVSLEIGSSPTAKDAENLAKTFINTVRPDILRSNRKILDTMMIRPSYTYVQPASGEQQEVSTQPQANITILNMTRPPLNGTPLISSSTEDSLIKFAYTGITSSGSSNPNQKQYRLLYGKIIFWPIDEEPGKLPIQDQGIYPLKPTLQAWQELQAGKGYILNAVNQGDNFNVRKVYMAYFEPEIPAKYIQPVWVFEGDKVDDSKFLFRAIVPAASYSSPVQ